MMTLWILFSLMLVGPPVKLQPAVPVRLSLPAGGHVQGQAIAWSDDGFTLEGAAAEVQWADVLPADRFRVWRQFLRSSNQDTLEGWTRVATVFLVLDDDRRLAKRATDRVKLLAGREQIEVVEAAILADVENQRAARAAKEAERRAEELKRGPPHRAVQRMQDWPVRVPDDQAKESERVRTMAEAMVDGLALRPAQSAAFLVFGPRETRVNALRALELDDLHASFAKFLGTESRVNIFQGVAVVILLPDYATMRLLAAEQFQFAVGEGVNAILFYQGDTPIILGVESSDHTAVAREAALAILHAHYSARGLELWFEAGLSECVANKMMPSSAIDSERRGRGLAAIRNAPATAQLEDFSPRGLGRDLSYLFVTRLIETKPVAVSRLIHRVKSGMPFNEAFTKSIGMSPVAYVANCTKWFTLND